MAGEHGAGSDAATGVDWDELLEQLPDQATDEGWLTLEEASAAAGVARSTLRSWYRAGHIPSRMVLGARTGRSGSFLSTRCSTARCAPRGCAARSNRAAR